MEGWNKRPSQVSPFLPIHLCLSLKHLRPLVPLGPRASLRFLLVLRVGGRQYCTLRVSLTLSPLHAWASAPERHKELAFVYSNKAVCFYFR